MIVSSDLVVAGGARFAHARARGSGAEQALPNRARRPVFARGLHVWVVKAGRLAVLVRRAPLPGFAACSAVEIRVLVPGQYNTNG